VLRQKYSDVMTLRNAYTNYLRIILSALLGMKRIDAKLRRQKLTLRVTPGEAHHLAKLVISGFSVAATDPDTVTVSDGKVILKCRLNSGFDLGHIEEIYVQKAYGTDFKDKVVIDAGASNGDSSIWFAVNGAKRVIALEPYHPSYLLAIENVRMNKLDDRVTVLNAALSSAMARTSLSVSGSSPNANAISPTRYVTDSLGVVFDGAVTVDTATLSQLKADYSIGTIDFLKLDCEGCEYDVLRNLADDVWPLINEIVLEYHNGLSDLPELMKSHGLSVISEEGGEVMGILHAVKNRSRD
jgi:FkbM family methyltransferase